MRRLSGALCGALLLATLVSCAPQGAAPPAASAAPAESADEFVARVNKELTALNEESNAAGWTQATYITIDTQLLDAKANERYLAYLNQALEQSRRFEGQKLSPATARALMKLRLNVPAPAPRTPRGVRA